MSGTNHPPPETPAFDPAASYMTLDVMAPGPMTTLQIAPPETESTLAFFTVWPPTGPVGDGGPSTIATSDGSTTLVRRSKTQLIR